MNAEIFTDPWARAWGEELAASEEYRRAAAAWEGVVAVVMEADPGFGVAEPRAVVLDLWHGRCRGARAAGEEDLATAPFVLRGTPTVWRRVLAGEVDPLLGLMSGKLKLARGNLARLLPFTAAAKEMVAAAGRLDSTFPAGWPEP